MIRKLLNWRVVAAALLGAAGGVIAVLLALGRVVRSAPPWGYASMAAGVLVVTLLAAVLLAAQHGWSQKLLIGAIQWWLAGAIGVTAVSGSLSLAGVGALQRVKEWERLPDGFSREDVLFEDDFDGPYERWDHFEDTWAVVVEDGRGRMACSFPGENDEFTTVDVPGSEEWLDYRLDADFRIQSCAAPSAGIRVRSWDLWDYFFTIGPASTRLGLRHDYYAPVPGDMLAGPVGVDVRAGYWHAVTVIASGSTVSLHIDGRPILTHVDESADALLAGSVGFSGSPGCRLCIDHVRVLNLRR